jgi:hypothetical protein
LRSLILLVALAFIIVFAALTLAVISQHGLDILTVISVLILGLMAVGIVGALRNPPDE